MVHYREILRLENAGYSQRKIAESVHSSRKTIREVSQLAKDKGVHWPLPEKMTNEAIKKALYPQKEAKRKRKMPDYETLHKELARPGVTLTLLWSEYCQQCAAEKQLPYQYTQFCDYYRAYAQKTKATMRIKRKPGELLEVDWAGKTLTVYDPITGEAYPAYIFVATLPCSLYSYAHAFADMKTDHWINAHMNAYRFFGGSTRILVPDNLKTAIIKNTRDDLVFNRTYNEMAEHYNTAVIPARPVSPKDKPNAEGAVGVISTWIIAALRNEQFFSFPELNQAIDKRLTTFNTTPFQKKPGSRLSAFEEEEKPFLQPLPAYEYEMALWSKAVVQKDYLITVAKNKYSVPYEFIGHSVEVRYTTKTVEVFYHHHRIASHIRRIGYADPQILPEHMPEKHRRYLARNKETYIQWAQTIGESTLTVIKTFFASVKVEQQAYRNGSALMRLSDKYSVERLENACTRALTYTPSPSLKNIRTILQTGQDKVKADQPKTNKTQNPHSFLRGAQYFGGDA